MTSSDILIEAIKSFEGCKLFAYRDTSGVPTIGIGHTSGVRMGQAITQKQANQLLREDLAQSERFVNNLQVCKTQGQFDALVDFVFNVGSSHLYKSTLLKKIQAGEDSDTLAADYQSIPNEYFNGKKPVSLTGQQMYKHVIQYWFSLWRKDNGKILPGLVKRRAWESQRFFE